MWAPVEGRYGPMEAGTGVNHGRFFAPGVFQFDRDGLRWPDNRQMWDVTGGVFIPLREFERVDDLVAEWVDDGPVRTVTRQEIVPGTYGRLGVGEAFGGVVAVGWVGHHNATYPRLTADELDAAARVLAQLAEALRNGQ